MSSGGGGGSGKQTTTTEPWKGAIPYLTGTDSTPGMLPEAARLYQANAFTPEMAQAADYYKSLFPGRVEGSRIMTGIANDIGRGGFDAIMNQAAPVYAQDVNMQRARAAQGSVDPTEALQMALSGKVNTQYLDPLANTITTNITRNTRENVLPSVRSEFLGAGQYGGSRQGVAEGLAISRLQQDLATGIAPMYAGAFENAQNRSASTATELNRQAAEIAIANANRELAAGQFNSNLTLQGNQQNLAAQQANVNNRLRASDLYGQALNFQDLGFSQYQDVLGLPNAYNQQSLANYASIIQPGAGLGGTTTQRANQGRNPIASAAGGAMLGASIPGAGAVGAGIGGILGLLTGLV